MAININKAVDKALEGKSLKQIAESPIAGLEGIGDATAEALEKFFHVKTVKDLAHNKYFLWAQAIVKLAEVEE